MKVPIFVFCLFAFGSVSGQVYSYSAFPKNTGEWIYSKFDDYYNFIGMYSNVYWVDSSSGIMQNNNESYFENNKRIFYKTAVDSTYKLLYDFNLTVGDTFVNAFYEPGFFLDSIGVVSIDDSTGASSILWPNRRSLKVGNATWIEGIGNVSSSVGIEHPLNSGTISGGMQFSCIFADSASYPCNNIVVQEYFSNKNGFSVYPNPASIELNFTLPKETSTVQFKLINLQGKTVYESTIYASKPKVVLPLLANGLYVVQLYQKGKLLFLEKLSLYR